MNPDLLRWTIKISNDQGALGTCSLVKYFWQYDGTSLYKGTIDVTIESDMSFFSKINTNQKNLVFFIECLFHNEFNQKFYINYIKEINASIGSNENNIKIDLSCSFVKNLNYIESFFNELKNKNNWIQNGF